MAMAPPEGFAWDPDKYELTFRKHRIRFDQAIFAFSDAAGFDFDVEWVEGEPRMSWLGMVSGIVVYRTR